MDLTTIYNLLHNAVNYHHFMSLNNKIIEIDETNQLTNSRKCDTISSIKSGKNKILNFIKRSAKTTNNTK